MNRATVNKIFQKHPVYVKAGMIAVISIIIFGCVYSKDNGKKLEKDEKGREILRRNESGKDELKNMKVKIDEKQEDISISVSGKKYDEEELKNAFSEAEKEVEQAVLGKNKSLDEVRSDLNLITSVPEKNMKVSWELDRYDVMDIQGHLQQDNLSTEGTLIKLTVILTYEDEEERYEFYAKVFPSELSADIAKGVPGAADWDYKMSEARKRLDWEEMFRLSMDPEKARRYRAEAKPEKEDTCSMCGNFCAVKNTNRILDGEIVTIFDE